MHNAQQEQAEQTMTELMPTVGPLITQWEQDGNHEAMATAFLDVAYGKFRDGLEASNAVEDEIRIREACRDIRAERAGRGRNPFVQSKVNMERDRGLRSLSYAVICGWNRRRAEENAGVEWARRFAAGVA